MSETSSGQGGSGTPDEGAGPARRTCYRHPDRYAPVRCQRCDRPICPDCMTPAAVGFQCPECVRAGMKATRTARTSFGGVVPREATTTSLALIAVNAVVWLAIQASGGYRSPLYGLLGLSPVDVVLGGALWQPLTSMFTHVDLLHIGFNMLALYFLGPQLEQVLGRARFLAVYLLSGLTGSLLVLWLAASATTTIGASGSIFGLLGALLVVFVRRSLPLNGLLVWLGLNVVITVLGRNISWEAHLGGFLGGAAVMGVLAYAPRERRRSWQLIGLGLIAAVLLLGFALRLLVGLRVAG